MRTIKFSAFTIFIFTIFIMGGCTDELKDMKVQNDIQRNRINELTSELKANELKMDKLQRELDATKGLSGIELDVLNQKIAALEKDIADKKALIGSMQGQLLYGTELPVELSTLLEDFAKDSDMVTFDSTRGLVKFKSDLLFQPGSDVVAPQAINAVKALCGILNGDEGKNFDVIVAGHTDDVRIGKAETRIKHPTNWHLSAHRAIAVLDVMARNAIDSNRMSVRGFGEFRPLEANEPNKKGNSANRRVEIYIVAKGT
ncbi:MAG: OmpA family protein [Phycisphaerae bacterium]|nr:OmpA family protein [Phycisphaerae bacterium]